MFFKPLFQPDALREIVTCFISIYIVVVDRFRLKFCFVFQQLNFSNSPSNKALLSPNRPSSSPAVHSQFSDIGELPQSHSDPRYVGGAPRAAVGGVMSTSIGGSRLGAAALQTNVRQGTNQIYNTATGGRQFMPQQFPNAYRTPPPPNVLSS